MTNPSGLNSKLFRSEAISEQTRAVNKRLEETLAKAPPMTQFTPQEIRDARRRGEGWVGEPIYLDRAENRQIQSLDGDVTLRTILPETVSGVYLHIHGGGMVLGAADLQDIMLARIADANQLAVVSVDYRLAPEDPYPAGPDDCEAAAAWLVKHAQAEFGTSRLFIGGESAGGTLSAVTLLRMRDRHNFTGFAGANLVYGAYDCSMTPSCSRWGDERNLILSTSSVVWFMDHYVPQDRRMDPDVSPLYADLHDMPPALFSIGTLDPLLDDSLFMYMRWLAAGNDAELAVYPGGVHGFNGLPETLDITEQFNQQVDSFFASILNDEAQH